MAEEQATPKKEPNAVASPAAKAAEAAAETEHYEEVAEYRIGEGAPPIFLIVAFFIIVVWACISWIPLFGY